MEAKGVESTTEKLARKIDGLIKDAPRDQDGNIEVQVTLMGDGNVSKGELPGECFEDGDKFNIAPDIARRLALRGYVSIAKAKAAKKAD